MKKNLITQRITAFTLVELLVVISIVSFMLALILPALAAAKAQARSAICKSNLYQLVLANSGYALDNNDHYVPAAEDFWKWSGGLRRWHGARKKRDDPFDPLRGPLAEYLGAGQVRQCPEDTAFVQAYEWNDSFEKGCGGYGYNMTYLGSTIWQGGVSSMAAYKNSYRLTTKTQQVQHLWKTLMFADCAMGKIKNGVPYLIEYSFAEPPHPVVNGEPLAKVFMSPSIHFRHRERANLAWADGHIDSRNIGPFDDDNIYGVKSSEVMLGWFDPIDNNLFDLK